MYRRNPSSGKLEGRDLLYSSKSVSCRVIFRVTVDIDDPEVVKKFTRIIDMLEEDDDVQAVYHNANLPEEDDED